MTFRRLAILGAALCVTVPILPVRANAIELSGAWATEADLCSRVFSKKGNGFVFAELSDLFGSGFIIEGNRITGKSARCTITSKKQDGVVSTGSTQHFILAGKDEVWR